MSRALLDIQPDIYKHVEKLQFSLFLISCCPEILNSSWLSWYLVLKIACLHVSFTAYENFYKLSRMYCLLVWFSTFQPSIRSIRKQISNNQTYIHLYPDLIIHKYIRTPPTYKCPHSHPCYFLSTNWPTVWVLSHCHASSHTTQFPLFFFQTTKCT